MMSSSQVEPVSVSQAGLLVAFFGLYSYVWGAANLEGFMNYPFWRDMGQSMSNEEFLRLRSTHLWKVYPLLVAPFVTLVVISVVLVFLGPSFIPRSVFILIAALELVALMSTVAIQAPIQMLHNTQGYDLAAFDRLIFTDFWLRKAPRILEAPFVVYVMWKLIAR